MPGADDASVVSPQRSRVKEHRSGGVDGFVYVSPPILQESQSLPAIGRTEHLQQQQQPQAERAFPKDARARNEVLRAYGGGGSPRRVRGDGASRPIRGDGSPRRMGGDGSRPRIRGEGSPTRTRIGKAPMAGGGGGLIQRLGLPPGSIPRSLLPPEGSASRLDAAMPQTEAAAPAFRSPLLTLEFKLMQAMGGDEVSPTLHRVAACFETLKGLIATVSQPFRPLLTVLRRELWAAVYDSRRHGAVAHFDELHRLRTLIAQRDTELAAVRADATRRALENVLLREELEDADVGGFHELELPFQAQAIAKGDGSSLARLTAEAAGRSVFDRVDNAKRNFKLAPGRRNVALVEAAARRIDPLAQKEDAVSDLEQRIRDHGDHKAKRQASMGVSTDGERDEEDAAAALESWEEKELRRLNEALQGAVPRTHYDAVCQQLEEANKRLNDFLTIADREAPTYDEGKLEVLGNLAEGASPTHGGSRSRPPAV